MKILVISDYYPPHYIGGYELMCQKVTDQLISAGHEVLVLTSKFGTENGTIEGHIHRQLTRITLNNHPQKIASLFTTRANYALTQSLARQFQPDFAYLWNIREVSILPALAMQDMGIATMYKFGSHWLAHAYQHYTRVNSPIKKLYRRFQIGLRQFEELDFTVATFDSESLRQSYVNAGVNFRQSAVVPSFIDDRWATGEAKQAIHSPLKLLYAGRFDPDKGIMVVVEAFAHLVQEHATTDVTLTLIGSGDEATMSELHQIIAEHQLSDLIEFHPFLPHDDLMSTLHHYDLLLYPTLAWEGFGLTIVEAMSQGVPAIASDIGGPRDIVQDGKTGVLIPSGSATALANAILELAQQPERLLAMSQAGVAVVREKYTASHVGKQLQDFMRATIGSS